MKKMSLKRFSSVFCIIVALFAGNLQAMNIPKNIKKRPQETFTVLMNLNSKDRKRVEVSYKALMQNKKCLKYKKNKVNFPTLVNSTYKSFYKKIWGNNNVSIYQVKQSHFTLATAGTVKNGMVHSFDGRKVVSLKDAKKAVRTAINDHVKFYKNKFNKKYVPEIGANLQDGAHFLYDPKKTTAKNVFVVQKLSFGYPGKNHRLYQLGMAIKNALTKIGLKPRYPGFEPHVSLANVFCPEYKVINKLKSLEKKLNTTISKIFKSVPGTKTIGPRFSLGKVEISVGTLKSSKTIGKYNFK